MITAKTKTSMLSSEGLCVVDGDLVSGNLILTRENTTTIDCGDIIGPQGDPGFGDCELVRGTYTPALVGLATGTGGTPINTATYQFIGGANVGDYGVMNIGWHFQFGSSGQTFPTSSPRFGLPSGFAFDINGGVSNAYEIGYLMMIDVSASVNNCSGHFVRIGTSLIMVMDSSTGTRVDITTTVPFTWASGDRIIGNVQGIATVRT